VDPRKSIRPRIALTNFIIATLLLVGSTSLFYFIVRDDISTNIGNALKTIAVVVAKVKIRFTQMESHRDIANGGNDLEYSHLTSRNVIEDQR